MLRKISAVFCAAVFFTPCAAFATAGYVQHGYGLKSKGMGGVGIALPQDALAAAANPAGMAWIGSRWDAGIEWFDADRGAEITGNGSGLDGRHDANGRRGFPVPELGYNRMLDSQRAVGVSVYGNGGVTRYERNPFAALGGTSPSGFEFIQGFVSPTFAMKVDANHSFGASLNLVYQQFQARGLERFDQAAFSAHPGSVTNRGWDHALGIGFRVGWLGQVAPAVTLGATYQPKIRMQKFERYKGLFADGGSFDVAENFGVGVAWKPAARWTLAADLQQISYSKVAALGNSADCFLANACRLGASGGPGSGWRDVTFLKGGVAYEASANLVLRAGFARLRQPIPRSQTLLAVVAPAVAENHLTAGATWQIATGMELTLYGMHAFETNVRGSGSIPPGAPPGGVGGGEANLRMSQTAIGVAWGARF